MSTSSSPDTTGITIDELLALNEEIGALVRAGVPLELGLGQLGRELPGRLGQVATRLAEQMQLGRPLVEVLGDSQLGIPSAYRAVVAAGLRGGRLGAALEAVTASGRRLADLRSTIITSLGYPLLLVVVGWSLMALFAAKVAPALAPSVAEMTGPTTGTLLLQGIARWGTTARYWGPALPLAIILAVGQWWHASRRALTTDPARARRLLGWFPWCGAVLRLSAVAAFTEILAVLVENGVPLVEALGLAAEPTQDPRIGRLAAQWAESLQRGDTVELPADAAQGLTPMLAWLVSLGQQRSALPAALRHAAETYHRQVEQRLHGLRIFLPAAATIVLGGGAVATLALAVFYPWFSLLYRLAGMG